jgi:hypothetical protein
LDAITRPDMHLEQIRVLVEDDLRRVDAVIERQLASDVDVNYMMTAQKPSNV